MSSALGERRIVSVLVADVAGSTAIGERLGPERSKALFDELARLMRTEVERFEGTVAQLTGDGLFALFGAPAAHEHDAERAVRSALAIQQAIAGYARQIADAYGVELAARVAVHTGPIVLPAEDAPPHERYNALGDTVNVAARLQETAGAGGVAIGAETARQVRMTFELEPLGELALKGKSQAVAAFRVVGEAAEIGPPERPLVGRTAELAALARVLEELGEGRGAIVVVSGEPGIGKSRLVTEARVAFGGDVSFLETAAVAYARGNPYEPVRTLLRSWLGVGVSDPEARIRIELKAGLARLAVDGYPFLAKLLGLALEPEAEETLEAFAGDSVQRQTHDAVMGVVRALARKRPLGVVFDDLQWADEPTLALLDDLLPLVDVEPLALVALQRTDPEQTSWTFVDEARRRYRHRFVEIVVAPLDAAECAALAASAAGATLPAELATLLAERAGGNPLFLEEALRDLLERGALRRVNAHLELVDGDASVPTLVQEALQARLDRLAPETREVVSLAAVTGKTFGTQLLERLVPRERLLRALSQLQRADLVVEERRRPAPEYRFRHGLVQEAAYAGLAESGRRALHRRVGDALEQLAAADAPEAYADLARHFAEADEAAKAADYLLRAGDAARAIYADEEAIRHYRRAVPFLDRLGDSSRARSTLFKVAHAHHLSFDFEAANAAWHEAFARPEPPPVRLEPTEDVVSSDGWFPGIRPLPGYAYITGAVWLTTHLFRGLLRLEQGLDPVPSLAARAAVSADGRVYRFALRRDARWSDGAPVTAGDFTFTYERLRALGAESAHLLDVIEEARAVDPRALELRLHEPRPYFLSLLAQAYAFPWPRHAVGEGPPSLDGLVGSGPFVLAEHGEDHAVLRPNAYWAGPRGNVAEARFESSVAGRESREAAWLGGGPAVQVDWPNSMLANLPDTVVEPVPVLGTGYLALRRRVPPLDDVRVRKALVLALDRGRLAAAWATTPARGGLIPPAMPGHTHDLMPDRDPRRARELLAAAGFADGAGVPAIEIVVHGLGSRERRGTAAEATFVESWRDLGVEARVRFARADDAEAAEHAHGLVHGWNADFPDPDGFVGSMLDSTRGWPHDVDDAQAVAALRRARSLSDRDARLAAYRDVDRLILEGAHMAPTKYEGLVLLRRPWIHGLWTSPLDWAPLDEVVVRR